MPDSPLRDRLQASLGTNFTLERELGGGGMSRVFVADDVGLARKVVVKVLPPEMAAGVSIERFRREIMLAARLQHPHVVPVLSAGEAGDLPYFTMPFIEGESLRVRLARGGELPVAEGLRILREVASALDYAHEKGIVHRDIKPDNVLLSRGSAMVTDFGVAKALSASSNGEASGMTSLGVALGTPAYMSPEQAAASPNIDTRADIYSFGILAYELFAGRAPFAGRSPQAMLAAHVAEPPEPLQKLRSALPPALSALVMRCLEKRPADRPQTAADIVHALDAITTPSGGTAPTSVGMMPSAAIPPARARRRVDGRVAAVVALVLVAAVTVFVVRDKRSAHPNARPRLIVLPFENLGPATDAYFAAGLSDEITSRLSTVGGIEVVGRTTAQQYQRTTKTSRELARELGVTHVLTGTVRWEKSPDGASRVRVSPQLVRASDQTGIWAEPFEGPLSSVFEFQARVAERVAQALDVALRPPEQRSLGGRPTRNLEAYDAYLRGLANSTRPKVYDPEGRRDAVRDFTRAVELDSTFAAAHARLAIAYVNSLIQGGDTTLGRAKQSLDRALALDSTALESRMAQISYLTITDPEGALPIATRAVADLPNSVELIVRLGLVQWALHRELEAVATIERAEKLDPRSPDPPAWLAGVTDQLGRHSDAIRWREREISLTPDNRAAYYANWASYLLWKADTATARHQLERGIDAIGLARMGPRLGLWPLGPLARAAMPRALVAFADTASLTTLKLSPEMFHQVKAIHFLQGGQGDRARLHADSAIAVTKLRDNDDAAAHAVLALMHALVGRTADEARESDRAVALADRSPDGLVVAFPYAMAAEADVLAGRAEVALDRLEKAFSHHSGFILTPALLRSDPLWIPLRGNARFNRLLSDSR